MASACSATAAHADQGRQVRSSHVGRGFLVGVQRGLSFRVTWQHRPAQVPTDHASASCRLCVPCDANTATPHPASVAKLQSGISPFEENSSPMPNPSRLRERGVPTPSTALPRPTQSSPTPREPSNGSSGGVHQKGSQAADPATEVIIPRPHPGAAAPTPSPPRRTRLRRAGFRRRGDGDRRRRQRRGRRGVRPGRPPGPQVKDTPDRCSAIDSPPRRRPDCGHRRHAAGAGCWR